MGRHDYAQYSYKGGAQDVEDPHAVEFDSIMTARVPVAFREAYVNTSHKCHADAVALRERQLQTLRRRVATCAIADPVRPANLLALGDLYVEVGVFVVVAVAYATLAVYSWRKFQTLLMYLRLRLRVRALRAPRSAAAAAPRRATSSTATSSAAAAATAAPVRSRSPSVSPGRAAAALSLHTRSPAALPPRGPSVTGTQARAQIIRERIRKNYGFCAHVWRFLAVVVVLAPGLVLFYPAADMFMSQSPRAQVVDTRAPSVGDIWAAAMDDWTALSAQRALRSKLGLSGPGYGWGRDGLQPCGVAIESFLLPGVLNIEGLLPDGGAAIAVAPVESGRLLLQKAKSLAANAQSFPFDPAEAAAAAAAVQPYALGEYAARVLSYFHQDDDVLTPLPTPTLPVPQTAPRRSLWSRIHSFGSGALSSVTNIATNIAVDGSQFLFSEALLAVVPTVVVDAFAWFAAFVRHCAGTVVWWIAVVGYAIAASKVMLPMLRNSDPTYAPGEQRDQLVADWQNVLWAEASRG